MQRFSLLVACAAGCASDDATTPADATDGDADTDTDTDTDTDGDTDTTDTDDTDLDTDTDTDTDLVYDCGAFDEEPSLWDSAVGLRAVVVAVDNQEDPLEEPNGITFAGGGFGGFLYVTDQTVETVWSVDTATGEMVAFVEPDDFPVAPSILTAIVWDAEGALGGDLFVTDSVTNGDQDTIIHRIDPAGNVSVFAQAPGPGLDSVFGMAIAPVGSALEGLYVAGDTDGATVDWGVFDAAGIGTPFSEVAGISGITFDPTGAYGDGPIAARPGSDGFDGDDSITPLGFDGLAGAPIATGLPGVHAVVVAPPGLFAGEIIAGSWVTEELFRVSPTGVVTTLVSDINFTNYDANVLAVSPDGRTLMVADRLRGQIVCVEEDTGP